MKSCLVIIVVTFLLFSAHTLKAQNFELLDAPATPSLLSDKGVLIDVLHAEQKFIALGERGHIVQWQANRPLVQESTPVSVTLTAIAQLDQQGMVAVGHDGVILTRDADSTEWQKRFDGYALSRLMVERLRQQLSERQAALEAASDPYEQDELAFLVEDTEFALEDAELELAQGPNKPLLDVISIGDKIIAIGAYGIILVSEDRGANWSLQNQLVDNPDKFHLNAITRDAQNNLFIVGENGLGFASYDQGESFEVMELPYYGSFFGISAAPNSPHLVAFGLKGNIAISPDRGLNWQLLKSPSQVSLLGADINEDGTVYLVGHGGVILSFVLNAQQDIKIQRHPSGASLAGVVAPNSQESPLTLVGQFGISQIMLAN